jgi:peptide deformylase
MMLTILTLPNAKLRERSQEIDPKELSKPEFQAWLDDLIETMHKADGVGIAAPQVGRQVRIFIATEHGTPYVVVNPVVLKKSWRMADGEEGCLSVPGKYGVVRRHHGFKIRALDRMGKKFELDAKGFFARVLQHELDHLDGVLYVDRAKKVINVHL